jgi:hypothetical protein
LQNERDRPLAEGAFGAADAAGKSGSASSDPRQPRSDAADLQVNVTDGIDLSADPIPRARSAAYSILYDQRSK